RYPAARPPRGPPGRAGPVRRGGPPAPRAHRGRGRADPQAPRGAAGAVDQARPLGVDRLLRPTPGRRLPRAAAGPHPAPPADPHPPAARGRGYQLRGGTVSPRNIPPAASFRGASWQVPRAPRHPHVGGLLVAVVALLWFSPLALVCWLLGQVIVSRQTRWHWHRIALAALGSIAMVIMVSGPLPALRRHFWIATHLWQYLALWLGFGPPGSRISIGDFLRDLLVTQVWLAVPVGVLAAALTVYFAEHAAGGAEWDPHVRRRQVVNQRAQVRKGARLL